MKYYDMHTHTMFSGDSKADPYDMADGAVAKKLKGICFTDHIDWDYPEDLEITFDVDMSSYLPEMLAVKKSYEDSLDVLIGIELGIQTHIAKQLYEFCDTYRQLDFIIGSSHVVNGKDPYYDYYFEGRSEREAYLEYFESVLANIKAFDGFDVYGHIDYIVRYGPEKNKNYTYSAYSDIIDEILRLLISKGKGIEINTAGFKYGLGEPNPCIDILKRYRELGGEIITTGSDAHVPTDIAGDFDRVERILVEAGFEYYSVFKKRKCEMIPLEKRYQK